MPNPYPDLGIGPSMGSANGYPAIYEQTLCYSKSVYQAPEHSDVICADLTSGNQTLVYANMKNGSDFPNGAIYTDLFNSRIVSTGGCGEEVSSWPFCHFDSDNPGFVEEIAPHLYGSHNSLWSDITVWYTPDWDKYDIRAYNFSAEVFIEITDDDESQLHPAVWGDYVVYMDLRFGDSPALYGDWNHSTIFLYELTTEETTQITSSEWIACYPDIFENIIIWLDYRACPDPNNVNNFSCAEIWGYNIDTSTEFQITNLPGRAKQTPRIWGENVFVDMAQASEGTNAIYMFPLPDGAK